jgi:hypothetical protein
LVGGVKGAMAILACGKAQVRTCELGQATQVRTPVFTGHL